MNINDIRAEERAGRINKIIAVIKDCLKKEIIIDFENLLNQLSFQHRITKRTAKEYLEVALSQIQDHELTRRDKRKIIKNKEYA